MKAKINRWINKGTEYHTSFYDKKRVRQINLVSLISTIFVIPIIIIHNLILEDYQEIKILMVIIAVQFIVLTFNMKGFNELASVGIIVFTIVISYLLVLTSDVQIGAPLVNIVIAMAAVHLIKHSLLKNILILFAFISFLLTNYYQLKYLPFREDEYFVVSVLLLLMYAVMMYSDFEFMRNQNMIESKNNELKAQNYTIKEQAEELRALEKTTYDQDLAMKQKDIDTVLANNRMQLQVRKNVIEQLQKASDKNLQKAVNSIILDLKNQIDTQQKLDLVHKNIDEVNAKFYARLLGTHPDISNSERDLCAYIKLGLSSKEMAALKNTSENTINVSKTRLRKKLGLVQNSELGTYLVNF